MIGDFGLKECILKEKGKSLTSGSNASLVVLTYAAKKASSRGTLLAIHPFKEGADILTQNGVVISSLFIHPGRGWYQGFQERD